jgi:hypothetical protein
VATRVLPDGVERQRRQVERDAVEDDRGSLAVSAAQRPREDGRGERKECHDHQHQGVQEQYRPVGCTNVVEHHMVVHPYLSDEQECDHVGEIRGPERDKVMQQVLAGSRRPDRQNEQGDGDGEDGVAERDQPIGVTRHSRGVDVFLALTRSHHRESRHPADR